MDKFNVKATNTVMELVIILKLEENELLNKNATLRWLSNTDNAKTATHSEQGTIW